MSKAATSTVPAARAAASLAPSQRAAYGQLLEALEISNLICVEGAAGTGKTLLVKHLLAERGGVRIGARDIVVAASGNAHPTYEDQMHKMVEDAFEKHDIVVLEDIDIQSDLGPKAYLRATYLQIVLQSFVETAQERGKRLVLTGTSFYPFPEYHTMPRISKRSNRVEISAPTAEDYAFHMERLLAGRMGNSMSPARVYEYAPGLSTYQLQQLCHLIARTAPKDEAEVRAILDTRILVNNTNLGEVADVKFSDLKGFEKIVDDLTTYVLNPLRFDTRFEGMGLLPKRGVLLYGPPGTGKTSIGRALAHQMKGKFFIIDGTFTTEPAAEFYFRLKTVFEAAKRATPSVIFIDDADVLFQSDRSTGLHRFLLTMLDGLESATAGKVAVIMTAMDPNHMPPALLRSGRVEMWIETRPPPEKARAEIIAAHLANLPAQFRDYDATRRVAETEGFNAADMRRLVADVKALYARDVVEARPIQSTDTYFEVAAHNVRRNKQLLKLAEEGKLLFSTTTAAKPTDEESKDRGRRQQEECGN